MLAEVIFWILLAVCLVASTLYLLWEQRRRWHDDWDKPLKRDKWQ